MLLQEETSLEIQGYITGEKSQERFLDTLNEHLSPRAVEYLISKYAYEARLDYVTPHTLRHTFCKFLTDAGESLDRVAVLAGHSNLNTTAHHTRSNGSSPPLV